MKGRPQPAAADRDESSESEQQYRQIVEAATEGIIKLDDDDAIVFVNRRFAELLGYEPGAMRGASLYSFMSAAAKLVATQWLHSPERLKDAIDTVFRDSRGIEISVNLSGTSLSDRDGRHSGNLVMVRDITEHRRLQSQLMVSDRMASVGTLAAGVAHELNNPLAAVIANLDYISESLEQVNVASAGMATATSEARWFLTEIKEPLDDAREAAQRVRLIVRDLKIFSRSPTEEQDGPVDVTAIMESSLRMAWNEIRHRAQVVRNYGVIPDVDANEAGLGQVFLNLVVNAAHAMQEGQAERNKLSVSTQLVGERVVIEVSDTGEGIPPENVGRIFDAFFTTRSAGTAGLGLAICRQIITDMGGDLTVRTEVGNGTTFRVALPVTRSVDTDAALPVPDRTSTRRARILVVDDDELVIRSVTRTLAKEHDVVSIAAAKVALARCAAGERFDLILCDLMMPDMTGMDLYRELLRVAPGQASKMIFLTGGAFTPAARLFLSETPQEQLEKPFDYVTLREIVQRHLR